MNIIFMLLGISIILALAFLAAFFWANTSGQHEDLYTPSVRVLFDDEPADPKKGDEDHLQN